MNTFGNLIWLIFGGFLAGIGYIIGGFGICLTVIGIPWGVKTIQFGFTVMTPFGKQTVPSRGGDGCVPMVLNIIWLVAFGWEIALAHIFFGIILAVTIVGIPFAKQHFKLIPIALLPFSYQLSK